MMPWANDMIRFAYFAGIKENMIGKSIDSRNQTIEYNMMNLKELSENQELQDTEEMLLLRSSVFKQEIIMKYGDMFKGMVSKLLMFHSNKALGGKYKELDAFDSW
jgi:hypothetical protein